MYRNVIVFDGETGRKMDYSIAPGENKFNGFVEENTGKRFLVESRTPDYEIVKKTPVYHFGTYVRTEGYKKPSIYKRPFPGFRRDEYKYQFTNTISKTTWETHDVYYNERLNKFLDKTRTRTTLNDYYIF
jgi:hypothetical protein